MSSVRKFSSFSQSSVRSGGVRSSAASSYGGGFGALSRGVYGAESAVSPAKAAFSSSSFSCVSLGGGGGGGGLLGGDEKLEMQDLNTRLEGYMEKVRHLESVNRALEVKINESRAGKVIVTNYDPLLATIEALITQITDAKLENAQISLEIDNARLAGDDFRTKWETEVLLRQSIESDVGNLQGLKLEYESEHGLLLSQFRLLDEECVFLKKNHAEEMSALRAQCSAEMSVEVDSAPGVELNETIAQIRAQYEGMIKSNQEEAAAAFRRQAEAVKATASQSEATLDAARKESKELRQSLQALTLQLEMLRSTNKSLEVVLSDTESRCDHELQALHAKLRRLESELAQLRSTEHAQLQDYQTLLNAKMKLEMEIATYRRLLEGEDARFVSTTTLNGRVALVDDDDDDDDDDGIPGGAKQKKKKVVKIITQTIVDGKVIDQDENVQESDMVE